MYTGTVVSLRKPVVGDDRDVSKDFTEFFSTIRYALFSLLIFTRMKLRDAETH